MIGWKFAYWIRRILVRNIFLECGSDVIIKHRAYFGTGAKVVLGDRSQLGHNSRIDNDTVIGCDVMMGPDAIIMSNSHEFSRLDIPMIAQGAAEGVRLSSKMMSGLVLVPSSCEVFAWVGVQSSDRGVS